MADDDQRGLLLKWTCSYHNKSMDELRQSPVLTMELQEARNKAEDELKMREKQILHLKHLLSTAIKERDEAQEKCHKMFFLLQQLHHCQQSTPHSAISSIEDDSRREIDSNRGFSSSCDESIVSSPERVLPPPPPAVEAETELLVEINRLLPEKGKLLQAVMKAGPLLQILLLAGPLPEWRHPPPPVHACQIPPPPVVVPPSFRTVSAHFLHQDLLHNHLNNCDRITRKRGLPECSDLSKKLKYQRVVLQ